MVNKNLWLGMLVMVLAFGMTVVGCDNGTTGGNGTGNGGSVGTALNGTWGLTQENIPYEYTFNNGDFETSMNNTLYSKGTYTTSGNKLTMNLTHVYGKSYPYEEMGFEAKWYTVTEFLSAYKTYLMEEMGMPEESWVQIGSTIQQQMQVVAINTYSVSGNTLTLTMDLSQVGGTGTQTTTWTKK